jgi:hypothetical protein
VANEKMTAEEAEAFIQALSDVDRRWLREQGWTQSRGRLLRPGRQTEHYCQPPGLDVGHGAIWRCDCGRRYRLTLTLDTPHSKAGQWKRRYWPWP